MQALIFDCDGVIADSEVLANTALAEALTEFGLPTTLSQSYQRHMGKTIDAIEADARAEIGDSLPKDFQTIVQDRTLARFRAELSEIPGFSAFLRRLGGLPKAVASSSAPARLAVTLNVLGVAKAFGRHVYSARIVANPKPHPDIYLHSAAALNIRPGECLAIEDSPSGVRSAVAAGMTVIGLTAASHIPNGHGEILTDAGASQIAASYADVERFVRPYSWG